MKKFDLTSLKLALLKSCPTVIETELFGSQVFIRRLTGEEMIAYEEGMASAIQDHEPRESSEKLLKIILDVLVQPDGTAIPDELKPSAAELLKAHENPALLEAVEKVKLHSLGRLEEAEKN